ncbi:hypothetical protein NL676_009370 [Syzygium grande]|nr:hypothetical protein NL676_009370 [Syzygium grande]
MQRCSPLPSLHRAQVLTPSQELARDLNMTLRCRNVQRTEAIRIHFFRELRHQLQELADSIEMAGHTSDVQQCVTGSFESRLLKDEPIASDQVDQLIDIALVSCFEQSLLDFRV